GVALLDGELEAAEALVAEQGEAAGERIERADPDGVLSERRRCGQRQAGGQRRLDENLHCFLLLPRGAAARAAPWQAASWAGGRSCFSRSGADNGDNQVA